ncbi:hypothetical protein N665_0086s0097 [Sinapis alba]|nr:hypothetical protein N665_0086s0097 [Sinapis alba]
MKFSQLVGILKAEEMESHIHQPKKVKDIAFAAKKDTNWVQALHKSLNQKIKDSVDLLAQNFNNTLRRIESGQGKSSNSHRGRNQTSRRSDIQCYECEGVGHYKSDCPLTKRKELKCSECKGYGHIRKECPNIQKRDDKALLRLSDTDSDEEANEDGMLNMVALVSKIDGNNSDSDYDDDEEIDPKVEFRKLYDSWVDLSNENLKLLKNKAMLEAQINILEMEKPVTSKREKSICSTSNNELHINTQAEQKNTLELEAKITRLSDLLSQEEEKNRSLEISLRDNHKKIRMLSTGTKDLNTLLAMGQPAKQNWGLGYKESRETKSVNDTRNQSGLINFVKHILVESVRSEVVRAAETKENVQSALQINKVDNCADSCVCVKAKNEVQQTRITYKAVETDNYVRQQRFNKGCCYSCGKRGHIARYCYERINNIRRAWKQKNCFIEPKCYGKFWIAKYVLYSKNDKDNTEDDFEVICNSDQLKQVQKSKKKMVKKRENDKVESASQQSLTLMSTTYKASKKVDGSMLVEKPRHV